MTDSFVRTFLVLWRSPTVARAQRRYFGRYPEMTSIGTALTYERDPAQRGRMLYRLSDLEFELAGLHPVAFGPDPIPHESGRDLSVSLAESAKLLRLYAETELASLITIDDGGEWPGDTVGEMALNMGATVVEADLWCQLAVTRDRFERAALMDQIWPHAAERVGANAAESFVCLIPTETTPTRRRPFPQPSRTVIAIAFMVLGLLILIPDLPKLPGMGAGHLVGALASGGWFAAFILAIPAAMWIGREINRFRKRNAR